MTESNAGGPTLRQLELLLMLVSAEGIASAGARLGMTASATSHALRALESALGTDVVDRSAGSVRLTPTGEAILPHVRDVFASLQIIKATASAGANLQSGLLTVGSHGASSSLNVLPPILEKFKQRYPGIDVFVTEKPDVEIERDLVERRIEVGVVALPKIDLDTQMLAVDELLAVLPPLHPLAALETIPVKALAEYPFVMTHAGSQPVIAKMFAQAGVKPKIVHDLTQILSILEFVKRGQGISVLASLVLPLDYKGVVYRRIRPTSTRRVGLACLDERKLSPVARALWNQVREANAKGLSAKPEAHVRALVALG
ncbi:LysR family transcriptional regulator [Pseudorhodoferax soli]|uniref:DNA-binding transcriptional LysR family regulator n=1 Tax=Pseudorhodoferax soli TaxID=545864 RepID=A0A368XKU2_9BURK|nr:LysR family transcriptional regulator [Pseudorhodoferax soli]RCW68592.1 DNA-binding transcriptional LysR family regulator [Pseudorhodoferax soli]